MTINCFEGVGLFFFNVSGLRVSGVTVEHCGISGSNRINEIMDMTREIIAFTKGPPPMFSAALLLIHCPDLEMSHTILCKNRGFGLVGINLIGNASFHRVQVSRNYPSSCVSVSHLIELAGGVGGGVYLIYKDYTREWADAYSKTAARLQFTGSNVTDNFMCRINLFHVIHNRLQKSIDRLVRSDSNTAFVGAGGVSLVMSQSFQLESLFESCVFRNNSGTFNGAAMFIALFELSDNSHVLIDRCVFGEN